MGKTKDLGHLAHIVAYDTENHITVPAGITMHTNQLVASQAWVTTALGSYALSSSLGSYVPTSRTITINGTSYDLSANRSWDITSMIYPAAGIPLSTGSAWGTSITNNSANWNTAYGWGNHASAGYLTGITSTQVTTALGYTPYNATNPNGYITGITSSNVTTALGYTPVTNARTITINGTAYDLSANREWTVSGSDSTKLPLAGGTMTGSITMATSGTSYIRMGNFPHVTTNSGEAWIGRAGDRSTGTMTVQLGSSNSSVFEVVDYGWTTVTLRVGMNDFTYKGNAVIHAGNISSQSVSLSSQVSINYNNDSNSTYQLLWGSGNSVYGTAQVYVNPSSDVIYARGGYISPGNPWGTSDSAYFPNGITTAGGTNWVYGNTYIGNAPGNGSGVNIASAGSSYFRSSNTAGTWGYAGLFVDRQYASNNYIPWSFENEYGTHSWGMVARFHIQQANADRPSIQFSAAGGNDRWSIGYCTSSDWNFRITQNQGYRTDNSTNDGWGTERFRINTDGNTYAAIGGTLYANGTQVVTNNGGTWSISVSGSANHLSPNYVGGVQSNPQTYFNNGIGLKVAMTGHWSVWSDTVWVNGYTGGDVPWMCALHFLRNSEPRFAITAQTHGSGSYGTIYEVITDYNIGGRTSGNTNSISNVLGTSHTWTGIQYFLTNNGGQAVNNSNSAKLQAYSTGNNSAFMSFHRAGYYAINFGLDDDNYMRIGGWSASANRWILNTVSGDCTVSGFQRAVDFYTTGWFRAYGDTGLYSQDYGGHLRRVVNAAHGTWELYGYTKNGYNGINVLDAQGYNNNLMFENGQGGIYSDNGSGWLFYLARPNDCVGINGSETYDWVRACTNGKHRITNDTWCDATSWAYTFSNISDGRLKENIITVDSALDKVLQLRGVYYNWIIDTENKKHIGLIAQETAAVCPEVVNYHDETDTYSVNYSELSGLFVESTKELNQKLIDANARIELLETKLNQLLNA